MNNITRLMLALAVSLALVACSKKVKESPDSNAGGNTGDTGATTNPYSGSGKFQPMDLDSHPCLRQRVVYFDFDQDMLKPEFQAAIACHAKYLQDRPESRMTLEGSADERGTREYNLGLGERRGMAVQSALSGAGASGGQLNVVSYGEERPVDRGHDESAWSKNRRVEIVYTTAN